MRLIYRFLALVLLLSPFGGRAEVRPDNETLEREIGPALTHTGDFALSDSKGEIFAVGRMLVDVTSIYAVPRSRTARRARERSTGCGISSGREDRRFCSTPT